MKSEAIDAGESPLNPPRVGDLGGDTIPQAARSAALIRIGAIIRTRSLASKKPKRGRQNLSENVRFLNEGDRFLSK